MHEHRVMTTAQLIEYLKLKSVFERIMLWVYSDGLPTALSLASSVLECLRVLEKAHRYENEAMIAASITKAISLVEQPNEYALLVSQVRRLLGLEYRQFTRDPRWQIALEQKFIALGATQQ